MTLGTLAGTMPASGTPVFTATVNGVPIPQGSKRIGRNRRTGKPILVEDNPETAPWRNHVTEVAGMIARNIRLPEPLDGPLRVRLTFTMPKPASAPKRRRTWPHTKPDVDKLTRAVHDALTDAGVWREDSRVQHVSAEKVYPGEPAHHGEALDRPGVQITVWRVEDVAP